MSTKHGIFFFTGSGCDRPDENLTVDISSFYTDHLEIYVARDSTKQKLDWMNSLIEIKTDKSGKKLTFTALESVDDTSKERNKLRLHHETIQEPAN